MTDSQEAPEGARRIAEVAAHLFARDGFNGVSMAALAREAGVSKAAIFHHFPSKEDLYFHVLKQACGELKAFLRDHVANHQDPKEAFEDFARFHMENLRRNPDVARLVMRELLEGDQDRLRALVEEVFGEVFQHLVALLREAQRAGRLAASHDPALVAGSLLNIQLFFAQTQAHWHHLPEVDFAGSPEAFNEGLLRLLEEGLLPRPEAKNQDPSDA